MDSNITILISVVALLISVFSLGWNVYRDVIIKPRLKVQMQISYIVHGEKEMGPYINIKATNFGPGHIICNGVVMANKSILHFLGRIILKLIKKDNKYAQIIHDYTNPYSAQIPKQLEVGESMDLYFTEDEKSFLADNPTHVGIIDTYGRYHWATRKSLKTAKADFLKDFPINKWRWQEKEKE